MQKLAIGAFLFLLSGGFAHAEDYPLTHAEPIQGQMAKGDEVRLIEGRVTTHYQNGGFGPEVSGFETNLIVDVADPESSMSFRISRAPYPGMAYAGRRIQFLTEQNQGLRRLGPGSPGYERFALVFSGNETFDLELVAPSDGRNPDLNYPGPYFQEAAFGLKNISR